MKLRERLEAFGIRAKKRLGQNFLHDTHALEAITRAVAAHQPEALIEIGPGPATLTDHLAGLGLPMVAVEKDPDLVGLLRSHLTDHPQVRIEAGDILDYDLGEAFPGSRPVVVGNIPYNISTPIVLALVAARYRLGPAILMLQAELAERLRAPVGSRQSGSLTVLLALLATVRRVLSLPPAAFSPPPKVRSEVLEIRWRDRPAVEVSAVERFERLVRTGFGQRRKTLRNALRAAFPEESLSEAATQSGVDLGRRAETLTLDEWGALERALHQRAR